MRAHHPTSHHIHICIHSRASWWQAICFASWTYVYEKMCIFKQIKKNEEEYDEMEWVGIDANIEGTKGTNSVKCRCYMYVFSKSISLICSYSCSIEDFLFLSFTHARNIYIHCRNLFFESFLFLLSMFIWQWNKTKSIYFLKGFDWIRLIHCANLLETHSFIGNFFMKITFPHNRTAQKLFFPVCLWHFNR